MSSDVALSAVNRLPSFGVKIAFPLLGCKVAPPTSFFDHSSVTFNLFRLFDTLRSFIQG